jgi:MFS superfamily sulfate permease-like transporter
MNMDHEPMRKEQLEDDADNAGSDVLMESSDMTNASVASREIVWHPVARLKQLWGDLTVAEISGSFGDLGSLIPIVVALAQQRRIHLASVLFFGGLSNIVTGYMWDRPLCVQPMHSIAAVALAEGLTSTQVSAAGIWMGLFLVFLAVTGFIDTINKIIPKPVVAGLQLGVGLNLAIKGVSTVAALSWTSHVDSKVLGIVLALLALFGLRDNLQKPVGIYLFGIGLVLAIYELSQTNALKSLQLFGSPVIVWALSGVNQKDWWTGMMEGALPQLPLTTLNSVISVCHLCHSLYPNQQNLTRKEVALSIGIMNLVCIPLGGMPNCHGAGGLAGQHRMGARTGSSVVFLGVWKVILGFFLGASALVLLDALPKAVLGIMLGIAGLELAITGMMLLFSESSQPTKFRQEVMIAMVTALVILGMRKAHFGAMAGWFTWLVYGDGVQEIRLWICGDSSSSSYIDCALDDDNNNNNRDTQQRSV